MPAPEYSSPSTLFFIPHSPLSVTPRIHHFQAEQQVEQLDEGLRAMARERDELVNEIEEAREIGQEHREIHMVLQQRAEEAQRDADAPGDTPG